ncbi:thioredoxin [Candidatus Thiosymbion oneisti]|uniref:thioredoxin n=1 Tax=Candidatus Thiosymbion oneisti TaxID=589554 RepID=UPI000B7F501C|nr:thioredoxin [Candidatus Thiosymbion oneisti]
MADSPYVIAVTAESFRRVVVEGSHERLVLVDFWADWCAPCRMLMPVLASLADAYGGKLLVAKVNTEEEQALAVEYGIRSLPTVQLFKDGRPIDQFMGALPEPQVREFLERHLPRESDRLLAQARGLLNAGDRAGAARIIEQAREAEPENARVRLVEAEIEAAAGNVQGAQAILDDLPRELADDPEVARLKGQVGFAAIQVDSPPEATLVSRLEADPKDSDARHRLAAHLVARGDFEGALEQLLELMKRDRAFADDAGRKGMLMIFAMLGGQGDLVTRYRSRMLNALY